MESDDLVRSIAAEVIKRLNGSGSGSGTGTGAPRGIGVSASASQSVGAQDRRTLVLLTGGDNNLDEALVQLGLISERAAATTVVLSPSANRVVGVPAIRRVAPEAEVLSEGDVDSIISGVEQVYLPNMSLNAASKISRLSPDSLVCILAVQSLLRGLPVVAAQDSLVPAGMNLASVPAGVRARMEGLLDDLRSMGVRVCSVAQLSSGAGTAPVQSAPAGPNTTSASPARASAGRVKTSGVSCGQRDGSGCSGCGQCVEQLPQVVSKMVDVGAARVGAAMGAQPASANMAQNIDHTLLKADATESAVRKLCAEAREHVFASVCVNPAWVNLAARELRDSPVKVCTVIGFPLGATTPTAKGIETRDAIANGADEIDMVINVGALKSGDDDLVRRDIEAVVNAARGQGLVKVILETALLSQEEKVKGCLLSKMAGADFVKTSTGFSSGGATVEDIALMRETVGPEMGVKASGGISDRATADAMVAAGATRIGASASVAIATGQKAAAGSGY